MPTCTGQAKGRQGPAPGPGQKPGPARGREDAPVKQAQQQSPLASTGQHDRRLLSSSRPNWRQSSCDEPTRSASAALAPPAAGARSRPKPGSTMASRVGTPSAWPGDPCRARGSRVSGRFRGACRRPAVRSPGRQAQAEAGRSGAPAGCESSAVPAAPPFRWQLLEAMGPPSCPPGLEARRHSSQCQPRRAVQDGLAPVAGQEGRSGRGSSWSSRANPCHDPFVPVPQGQNREPGGGSTRATSRGSSRTGPIGQASSGALVAGFMVASPADFNRFPGHLFQWPIGSERKASRRLAGSAD